jgi:hypothetical protein
MKIRVALVAASLALLPATARADERPPRGLELSLSWGLARMIQPSVDHGRELSAANGGLALSARILARTGVSLSPLFEVGTTPLYRSDERVPGSSEVIRSSLSAFHAVFGLGFGRAWLRPWVGFAAYRVAVTSTLSGVTIKPASWSFGYAGGLEARVVSTSRVSVGLHATLHVVAEAQTTALIGGAVVSGDAITWLGLRSRLAYRRRPRCAAP